MEHRKLAEQLRDAMEAETWPPFADYCRELCDRWKKNLNYCDLSKDIEEIAIERVHWTSMVSGIEKMFFQMNELIKELKREEEKENDRKG